MDWAKFYNEQPEYIAFRNDKEKQEEYKIAVDWKVRKLSKLIPASFDIKEILESYPHIFKQKYSFNTKTQ